MKVYAVEVITESCDHYTYVYLNKPTREEVIKRLMKDEGAHKSDFKHYEEQTSIEIRHTVVIGTEEE